eukprot:351335-Chlamydomonas_euryale.AAC.7
MDHKKEAGTDTHGRAAPKKPIWRSVSPSERRYGFTYGYTHTCSRSHLGGNQGRGGLLELPFHCRFEAHKHLCLALEQQDEACIGVSRRSLNGYAGQTHPHPPGNGRRNGQPDVCNFTSAAKKEGKAQRDCATSPHSQRRQSKREQPLAAMQPADKQMPRQAGCVWVWGWNTPRL